MFNKMSMLYCWQMYFFPPPGFVTYMPTITVSCNLVWQIVSTINKNERWVGGLLHMVFWWCWFPLWSRHSWLEMRPGVGDNDPRWNIWEKNPCDQKWVSWTTWSREFKVPWFEGIPLEKTDDIGSFLMSLRGVMIFGCNRVDAVNSPWTSLGIRIIMRPAPLVD